MGLSTMGACITAGPNRALVKSGTCAAGEDGNGPQVTGDGGCIFVMPFCQTYGELDLTIKTIQLHSQKVLSKKGVDVSLHGVAQVRINKVHATHTLRLTVLVTCGTLMCVCLDPDDLTL